MAKEKLHTVSLDMPEWAYHDLIILSKGKIAEYVGFIMLEDVKKNGELIARLKRKKGL